MNELYHIHIQRNDTEFEVLHFKFPEDDYGKATLAFMLIRIAENLNPNLITQNAPGGDGA